jgi:hypothetical protein
MNLLLSEEGTNFKARSIAAKNALDDPVSNCSIPYNYFRPLIMEYILKHWQGSWDQQIYNKLHEIHSLVGKTP